MALKVATCSMSPKTLQERPAAVGRKRRGAERNKGGNQKEKEESQLCGLALIHRDRTLPKV